MNLIVANFLRFSNHNSASSGAFLTKFAGFVTFSFRDLSKTARPAKKLQKSKMLETNFLRIKTTTIQRRREVGRVLGLDGLKGIFVCIGVFRTLNYTISMLNHCEMHTILGTC